MKKILAYIQSHFLLRNILLAICFVIVFTYFISIMLNVFTRHNQKYSVPNFIGMSIEQAREASKNASLDLIISDSLYMPKSKPGTILDQSPKAEMGVKSGRKIFLTINSLRPKTDVIPYVAGFSLRQAKNKLESRGFEIQKLIYVNDMATNNVISQSWNGTKIAKGSTLKAELGSGITLTVGRNARSAIPIVPKVIGKTLREAKSALWEIGFNLAEAKYDHGIAPEDYDRARVFKQTPLQDSRSDYGSRVTLWLTLDEKRITNYSKQADIESLKEMTVDTIDEQEMLQALGIDEN